MKARTEEHKQILAALRANEQEGHCFMDYRAVAEAVSDKENYTIVLGDLIAEGIVTMDGDRVYLSPTLRAEREVAAFISAPPCALRNAAFSEADFDPILSDEQRAAAWASLKNRISIITGGPGSGKTTLIKSIAHSLRSVGHRVSLAAPTGRAAQRMGLVCGMPSSTIHRLLRWTKRGFVHNEYDPVPSDAFIIDETSMLDTQLAAALFKGIPRYARVILVGDKDQLPSVGPGRIFADLISSHKVKVSYLTKIFRRDETNNINVIASEINAGVLPKIPELGTESDAYMMESDSPSRTMGQLIYMVTTAIPKVLGIDPRRVAVLTPANQGPLGVDSINTALQRKLNNDPKPSIWIGRSPVKAGDPVCQRVNNYVLDESGIFNGDTGIVESVARAIGGCTVKLWDGRTISYGPDYVRQLSLSYAMTVHRSQGLEMDAVVLVLDDTHGPLLTRQLVYTAVTRAKRMLIILGSRHALEVAVKNNAPLARRTHLIKRITEAANVILQQEQAVANSPGPGNHTRANDSRKASPRRKGLRTAGELQRPR